FGKPLEFYLFTLPAWQLVSGWLLTLSIIVAAVAAFFVVVSGGTRMLSRLRPGVPDTSTVALRGLSIAVAAVLLMFAVRVYLARFDKLFGEHTVFSGVTSPDAHRAITRLSI